mgnify:FL=1
MTEYCSVCYEYEDSGNFIVLSCGCKFCKNTTNNWILTQLEAFFKTSFKLLCPSNHESHALTEQDIKKSLYSENYHLYQEVLFRRTVIKNKEFKQCPRNGCDYVGWVESGLKCSELLECEKCGNKWSDPSLKSLSKKFAEFGLQIFSAEEDLSNYLWKKSWTKNCPMCQCPIQKNGGCPHMTCQNCSYEFCWYCKQNHFNHDNRKCIILNTVKFGLIGLSLIALFVYFVCLSEKLKEITLWFLYKGLIIGYLAIVTIQVIALVLVIDRFWRSSQTKLFFWVSLLLLSMVLTILLLYYQSSFLWDLLVVLLQLGFAGVCTLFGALAIQV